MKNASWHFNRRTFLRGTGVSLALPLLECMGAPPANTKRAKRFCGIYFPYGIVSRKPGEEQSEWNWFPDKAGSDYILHKSHTALEPLRDQFTMIGGLSHPAGRTMGGHDTADIWLTGAKLKGNRLQNQVSIDQLMAQQIGDLTRYRSLVISTDGGVGEPTRSSTLSFGRGGQPIPALNKPQQIFDRLFGVAPGSMLDQRRQLENSGSMIDLILEHSKSMRGKLGKQDQQKFDEYLSSVRQIEQSVERSQAWLDIPKPNVEATGLTLEADDSTPETLIQTMYDLILLAFQTDSTRVATYQLGNMNGATSIAGKFPSLLGLGKNMHGLAHGARKGPGGEQLGKWQQFLNTQFARFLTRLQETSDGEGTLLDSTVVLYGSSNHHTHQNLNYPLLLAGGERLGFRHGHYVNYDNKVPMANLLTTAFNKLDVQCNGFADSTGDLPELLI